LDGDTSLQRFLMGSREGNRRKGPLRAATSHRLNNGGGSNGEIKKPDSSTEQSHRTDDTENTEDGCGNLKS